MTYAQALALARLIRPMLAFLMTQVDLARQSGKLTDEQREKIRHEAGISDARVDEAVDEAQKRLDT